MGTFFTELDTTAGKLDDEEREVFETIKEAEREMTQWREALSAYVNMFWKNVKSKRGLSDNIKWEVTRTGDIINITDIEDKFDWERYAEFVRNLRATNNEAFENHFSVYKQVAEEVQPSYEQCEVRIMKKEYGFKVLCQKIYNKLKWPGKGF